MATQTRTFVYRAFKMGIGERIIDAVGVIRFGDSYSKMARRPEIISQVNKGNVNPIGIGTGETQFLELFRDNAFAKQIVCVPIEDALSKGRTWSGEDVAQEEIDKIINLEKSRHINLQTKLRDALICARLFGGAALLIGTNDQDLSLPLDPDKIPEGGLISLTLFSRFEFSKVDIEDDLGSPNHGSAKLFHLQLSKAGKSGTKGIHPTRLVVFHGDRIPVPRGIRTDMEFWGDGVLRSRMIGITALAQAYTSQEALLLEAKSPTMGVVGLAEKVKTDKGMAAVMREMSAFNIFRGITGLNVIDKEMEFKNNPYNFSGIKDVVDHFKSRVAGEADIPQPRLFGQASTGLSATGEGDLKNYYDRIKSDQENIISPPMAILDVALVRSALGKTNKVIKPYWNPLMTRTSKERADEFAIYAHWLTTLQGDSHITDDEFRKLLDRLITNSKIGET